MATGSTYFWLPKDALCVAAKKNKKCYNSPHATLQVEWRKVYTEDVRLANA